MCDITNLGFSHLLDNLQFNMSLKSLKLCYNKIGRVCHLCQTQLDCNKNKVPPAEVSKQQVTSSHGDEAVNGGVPGIEDIYDKLCQILQQNQDLKVLLWGNKLDDDDVSGCSRLCDKHSTTDDYSTSSVFTESGGTDTSFNVITDTTAPSLNKIQREFVEQYTIHPQPTGHINNNSPVYGTADLSNGHTGGSAHQLNCGMPARFSSDIIYPDTLNVNVQNPSALSCGTVYRPQVSPRMGTTATAVVNSLGSQPHLYTETADTTSHHPRIRTNGSLPWRHKHTTTAQTLGEECVGYFNEISEPVETESEFRPHTFPRRGYKNKITGV